MLGIDNDKRKGSDRVPFVDSVAVCRFSCRCRFNCRLPVQLPVADSFADSVAGCRFSCRLQIQLPIQLPVAYSAHFYRRPLRKHAYSNILKILPPKTENFQITETDIFPISAQNIDCGYSLEPPRRGGSNEYPQSMILSRNKKNNVYPCKPQFYYIKVGFKGVKII